MHKYLGTNFMISLFKGSVKSEESGKVLKWADHILVPSIIVNLMGILWNSFRMADITLFFVCSYLQFIPKKGEPMDSTLASSSFLSRLQHDWREMKD